MNINRASLMLLMVALTACGARPQATNPMPSVPTPTIAAAPAVPTSVPPAAVPALPATTVPSPTPAAQVQTASPTTFSYLWPSYLPDGMVISPTESRVPRENEIGTTAPGFYAVTFNGGDRKLVVGGGATDTLPLTGENREVSIDSGSATMTTNGEQRQLVFVRDRAKFFIYGRNIGEQELLLVAESLLPTDIAALRDITGSKAQ